MSGEHAFLIFGNLKRFSITSSLCSVKMMIRSAWHKPTAANWTCILVPFEISVYQLDKDVRREARRRRLKDERSHNVQRHAKQFIFMVILTKHTQKDRSGKTEIWVNNQEILREENINEGFKARTIYGKILLFFPLLGLVLMIQTTFMWCL